MFFAFEECCGPIITENRTSGGFSLLCVSVFLKLTEQVLMYEFNSLWVLHTVTHIGRHLSFLLCGIFILYCTVHFVLYTLGALDDICRFFYVVSASM